VPEDGHVEVVLGLVVLLRGGGLVEAGAEGEDLLLAEIVLELGALHADVAGGSGVAGLAEVLGQTVVPQVVGDADVHEQLVVGGVVAPDVAGLALLADVEGFSWGATVLYSLALFESGDGAIEGDSLRELVAGFTNETPEVVDRADRHGVDPVNGAAFDEVFPSGGVLRRVAIIAVEEVKSLDALEVGDVLVAFPVGEGFVVAGAVLLEAEVVVVPEDVLLDITFVGLGV
jgi:hypothetical protein